MSATFFGGVSEVVSEFDPYLLRELASLFCPISTRTSAISAGSLSVLPLVWQCLFLGDLDLSKVLPDSQGISEVIGRIVSFS